MKLLFDDFGLAIFSFILGLLMVGALGYVLSIFAF